MVCTCACMYLDAISTKYCSQIILMLRILKSLIEIIVIVIFCELLMITSLLFIIIIHMDECYCQYLSRLHHLLNF